MDVRERIRESFFSDVFMMLANSSNPQMTATEVAERHEEKMLMMGPVLERLNNELLYPLVEVTFTHMIEMGALPPAPQELAGMDLASSSSRCWPRRSARSAPIRSTGLSARWARWQD
jgi:hypothetical protein